MERRTSAETRKLLLDTGIAMLHEQGVTAGVAHIRLRDVLKRAGLTTGAAYRLWSDQSEFHHDLAVAATRWRDDSPLGRTVVAIRQLVEEKAPLRAVIRRAAATHIEGLVGVDGPGDDDEPWPSNSFLTTLALRAAAANTEELRAASSDRHHDSLSSFVDLYAALLHAYNRQMRPPFTLQHFAIALAALGEGFALQAIEGEEHPVVVLPGDDGEGEEEWTLFGVAVEALATAITEPIPATADGSCEPAG